MICRMDSMTNVSNGLAMRSNASRSEMVLFSSLSFIRSTIDASHDINIGQIRFVLPINIALKDDVGSSSSSSSSSTTIVGGSGNNPSEPFSTKPSSLIKLLYQDVCNGWHRSKPPCFSSYWTRRIMVATLALVRFLVVVVVVVGSRR